MKTPDMAHYYQRFRESKLGRTRLYDLETEMRIYRLGFSAVRERSAKVMQVKDDIILRWRLHNISLRLKRNTSD